MNAPLRHPDDIAHGSAEMARECIAEIMNRSALYSSLLVIMH